MRLLSQWDVVKLRQYYEKYQDHNTSAKPPIEQFSWNNTDVSEV